jgi:hypothetical protein
LIRNDKVITSTITDEQGLYKFTKLELGEYKLKLYKFETFIKEYIVKINKGENVFDIKLEDYIYRWDSKRIFVWSWFKGQIRTFYLYPSNPKFKAYRWEKEVIWAWNAQDAGTYIDYANNRLVIKIELKPKRRWWWFYTPAIYWAYYKLQSRIAIDADDNNNNNNLPLYGGDNQIRIKVSSYRHEVRTFYLYPSNPAYRIYKWKYIIHNSYYAWDAGSYIDEKNNRLVIRVSLRGYEWRFWWFTFKREARYDATYYVYGVLKDSKKSYPTAEEPIEDIIKEEEPQRISIKPKTMLKILLDTMTKENNTIKVSILLKDVEEELTEAKIDLKFDPSKIKIKEVIAPVFKKEEPTKGVMSTLSVTTEVHPKIYLHSQIDNNAGQAYIEAAIVIEEDIYKEEIVEDVGTSSVKTVMIDKFKSFEENEENIASIADLIIFVPKHLKAKDLERYVSSSLQLQDVNLTNSEGNQVEVEITQDIVVQALTVKESKVYQSYPNPARYEAWIPFKLKEPADIVLKIYNISGQLVKTEEFYHLNQGEYITNKINDSYIRTNNDIHRTPHAIYLKLRDENDTVLPSGIYFYQVIIKPINRLSKTKTFVERLAIIR